MFSRFYDLFKSENDELRKKGEIIYLNEEPENMNPQQIIAKVYGRVQGVAFRYSTEVLASEMAVAGIVRNESDGTVYVEATAPKEVMDEFIDRLALGPSPKARVEKVEITYTSGLTKYKSFSTVR